MKSIDPFICDFVSLLEVHGVIRSMKFWSIALFILATLHFVMAGLVVLILLIFPIDTHFLQLCFAFAFACMGYTWMKTGKECARRIKR